MKTYLEGFLRIELNLGLQVIQIWDGGNDKTSDDHIIKLNSDRAIRTNNGSMTIKLTW